MDGGGEEMAREAMGEAGPPARTRAKSAAGPDGDLIGDAGLVGDCATGAGGMEWRVEATEGDFGVAAETAPEISI